MTRDLLSKRTRNEFRDFLVRWTLSEIKKEFEAAHIDCDRSFEPEVQGERRALVEQYYRTLDFTKPENARRLLSAYESILERAERNLPAAYEDVEQAIEGLKTCLLKDGLKYQDGRITAVTPEARAIFEDDASRRSVSEVTRRAIFDELRMGDAWWAGRLSETEFLSRLYDLSKLPSHDARFDSMRDDIWQHRENNENIGDWNDDWVFTDSRLNLLGASDETFFKFLSEMVHPVVRPDSGEVLKLVELFNKELAADGWELARGPAISGRPKFVPRRRSSATVLFADHIQTADVLSDEYVRELSGKCDTRLAAADLDGAITVARTLLEAILGELELRLAGTRSDHKGELPRQFKQVAKLLRMDEQRPDLDDRFKDVIRGLVMVANGLASLRNKMSDGHARERMPAPHHARVVVNAAKTVAAFLVESYVYQREKGLIRDAPRTGKDATP